MKTLNHTNIIQPHAPPPLVKDPSILCNRLSISSTGGRKGLQFVHNYKTHLRKIFRDRKMGLDTWSHICHLSKCASPNTFTSSSFTIIQQIIKPCNQTMPINFNHKSFHLNSYFFNTTTNFYFGYNLSELIIYFASKPSQDSSRFMC